MTFLLSVPYLLLLLLVLLLLLNTLSLLRKTYKQSIDFHHRKKTPENLRL